MFGDGEGEGDRARLAGQGEGDRDTYLGVAVLEDVEVGALGAVLVNGVDQLPGVGDRPASQGLGPVPGEQVGALGGVQLGEQALAYGAGVGGLLKSTVTVTCGAFGPQAL